MKFINIEADIELNEAMDTTDAVQEFLTTAICNALFGLPFVAQIHAIQILEATTEDHENE